VRRDRRARAPNLRPIDRIIASLCAGLMRPACLLFAPRGTEAGPERAEPRTDRSDRRNETAEPSLRLSAHPQQIAFLFRVEIDKDVVRRVLTKHCRPTSGSGGPSWLNFLGHAKHGLWSVDLFRCESLILKTRWVVVVMDQFTRRIIGFAVQPGAVDGPALCRMLNQVIAGVSTLPPQQLSSDHDPLFEFHRWKLDSLASSKP
jgi:putative transposase